MNKDLSVIGTVLGETNLNEFSFTLKSHKASKGDIICTQTKIPSSENENKVIDVTVWGKIMSIDNFNNKIKYINYIFSKQLVFQQRFF